MSAKLFFADFLFYVSLVVIVFIPLPVFIDLNSFSIVLEQQPFPVISRPVPIGLFGFSVFIAINFANSLSFPEDYFRLPKRWMLFLICSSAFIFLWLILIAQASFFRSIQIALPLGLILFFSFPLSPEKQKKIVFLACSSCCLFIALHNMSVVLSSEGLADINEYDSAIFFSFGIYQAFVSYSAVVGMYAFMFFYFLLYDRSLRRKITNMVAFLSAIFLLALLARRASVIEFFIYIVGGVFFVFTTIFKKKVDRNDLINIFFVAFLVLAVCLAVKSFPVFDRFIKSGQSGSFDSGRIEIYLNAMQEMQGDIYLLLLGGGGKSGYHNYILDLIYTTGLAPILIISFLWLMFFCMKSNINFRRFTNVRGLDLYAFSCFFGIVLVQMMVNSSITQPYYLVNMLLVFQILMLYKKAV